MSVKRAGGGENRTEKLYHIYLLKHYLERTPTDAPQNLMAIAVADEVELVDYPNVTICPQTQPKPLK
ncbi:hypothetical protein Bpfe_008652 [Biomphalaria pfeifferi]|uniref:Uncharacterized protein n=1 Tax=Biomphalaria pfeifferi TaxID=112525 RepID=A0AAD8BVQ4_BIOPF|nr:hypothetical protein Bpfe_008652 [Biomphalaria pfeifferi]